MSSRLREIKLRRGAHRAPAALERLPSFIPPRRDAAPILRQLGGVVVGCGRIGRDVALHLARTGIGHLTLVDPKEFKPQSLATHSIPVSALRQGKAMFTARQCKDLNPLARVVAHTGFVEELPLRVLAGADFCVLATDNLAAEVFVGQRCLLLGVPLWQASVHGDTLVAQVRHFRNNHDDGPCPRCLFGRVEVEQLNRSVTFSCDGSSSGSATRRVAEAPTMSVSSLCGLAASLVHLEMLRSFLGLGCPAADGLTEFCAYTRRSVTAPLRRDPQCPCDHTRMARREAPWALRQCTLQDLAEAAGFTPSSFVVGDFVWAQPPGCDCPDPQSPGRFLRTDVNDPSRCARCRAPLVARPFFSHRTVPVQLLGAALRQPLTRLGAGRAGWVVARDPQQAALFLDANTQ